MDKRKMKQIKKQHKNVGWKNWVSNPWCNETFKYGERIPKVLESIYT